MRESLILAAAMAVFGYAARADGIAASLMQIDPCMEKAFTPDASIKVSLTETLMR